MELIPQQTGKTVSLMHENMKTMRQLEAENKKLQQQVVDLGVIIMQSRDAELVHKLESLLIASGIAR